MFESNETISMHGSPASRTPMPTDACTHFSSSLLKAVNRISEIASSNASCEEIASAVADCLTSTVAGCSALVVECAPGSRQGRILAAANAPTFESGSAVAIADNSLLNTAIRNPGRSHCGGSNEAYRTFSNRRDLPGDENRLLICKSVARSTGDAIVFVVFTGSERQQEAELVLMTLGVLVAALCAGETSARLHSSSLQQITKAKQEWERTVDALDDLVCLTDSTGIIVRANRASEQLYSCPIESVPGKSVHEVLHPDCREPACELAAALLPPVTGERFDGQRESLVSDDSHDRFLHVRVQPVTDAQSSQEGNSLVSAVVVVSDMTDLHRTREQLRALNSSLEQRVQTRTSELEEANQVLQQEMARRRAAEVSLQESRDELASLSRQLISAQEDERARLSRELHDSIGQSLGAIKYTLERLSTMSHRQSSLEGDAVLKSAIVGVMSAIQDTRSIAMRLRPPILDDMGPAAAVNWLVKQFATTYPDIEFLFEATVSNDDVDVRLATVIYRIAQESLNNAVKHAAPRSILAAIRHEGDRLVLEILDDGIGFDASRHDTGQFRKMGSFGRLGMRERAVSSNGVLTIESAPGKGTKVRVEWEIGGDKSTR